MSESDYPIVSAYCRNKYEEVLLHCMITFVMVNELLALVLDFIIKTAVDEMHECVIFDKK